MVVERKKQFLKIPSSFCVPSTTLNLIKLSKIADYLLSFTNLWLNKKCHATCVKLKREKLPQKVNKERRKVRAASLWLQSTLRGTSNVCASLRIWPAVGLRRQFVAGKNICRLKWGKPSMKWGTNECTLIMHAGICIRLHGRDEATGAAAVYDLLTFERLLLLAVNPRCADEGY